MSNAPTVELSIGGTWTDITDYVYQRDSINVTRGRADEASTVAPSTCAFTVNNIDGRFSPRNPLSPYYGQIGRNTPVRVSVWRNGTQYFRFYGEVSAWPVQWDISGNDVYVQVTASGIQRRLSQGNSPLKSAVYRDMTTRVKATTAIKAYWPCEDAAGATSVASGLTTGSSMRVTGTPTFANYSDWFGSDPLPTMGTATFTGTVPAYTATNETAIRFFLNINTAVATGATQELIHFQTTGTANDWSLRVGDGGFVGITVTAIASDGDTVTLANGDWAYNQNTAGPVMVTIQLTQSGANFTWQFQTTEIVDGALSSTPMTILGSTSGTVNGYTIGRVTSVIMGRQGGLTDINIGHISVANALDAYAQSGSSLEAWNDEDPAVRFTRLCTEEGIPNAITDDPTFTDNNATMGSQHSAAIMDLLQQIPATDLGMLYEPRDQLALGYRTRLSLYNQTPALTLDYEAQELSGTLAPIDDDQSTVNDVTVTRTDGSSYHTELDTGALSVLAPPNGVGRYDTSVTVSLGSDAQLDDQAGWRLHLGTVDEARYPQVSIQLSSDAFTSNAALMAAALTLDVGDRLVITNAPAWLPPGDISVIVQGYAETFDPFLHSITLNCTPESTWQTGVLDDPILGRLDTDGSQLAAAASAADTSISVAVTAGPLWTTDTNDLPFDIALGGEVMTVTAISGTASPQTFTVTRSVNGITKTQAAGADVRLANPLIISL